MSAECEICGVPIETINVRKYNNNLGMLMCELCFYSIGRQSLNRSGIICQDPALKSICATYITSTGLYQCQKCVLLNIVMFQRRIKLLRVE